MSGNKRGIVLNRMYVGTYLASNLGHEVINMYQADNGKHYLYLNATGDFTSNHKGKIGYMLLVKYHKAGEVEVIGLAKDLKDVFDSDLKKPDSYKENKRLSNSQVEYINKEGGISYGGASILDIFRQSEQQNVYITFSAEKLYVPKNNMRVFIRFAQKDNDGGCQIKKEYVDNSYSTDTHIFFCLSGFQQAKASLKQYMYPEGTFSGDFAKEKVEEKKNDFNLLMNHLILSNEIWRESEEKVDEQLISSRLEERKVSLFDICQIQNNENIFSNALCYFMLQPSYRKLWIRFFRDVCHISISEGYNVTREESAKIEDKSVKWTKKNSGGRIDLLVRDDRTLFAIENKIESDINRVDDDGDGAQLERYWNYLNWLSETKERERTVIKTIVLSPKYNVPEIKGDMGKYWEIYTYEDLYNFLKKNLDVFKKDQNFKSFFDAIKKHTYDNINAFLYFEMQDIFIRRILENRHK